MKKLKTIGLWLALALVALGCGEEGGLKGTLKISITDAPIDAGQIKAVNLTITNVEGYQNGNWKAFKNFEQPVGVNLLAYTGGKSILLIDQFTSPGEYSSLRLTLNMANRNSSLIISPQSNVVFKNGTSAPICMKEGAPPQVVLEKAFGVYSRGITDITLDFDLRKSISLNSEGEYLLDPSIRFVKTNETGRIEASLLNASISGQVVAYVYKSGAFSDSEANETGGGPPFYGAITSSRVGATPFAFGFLEAGTYDLVFVKHNEDGKTLEIMGKLTGIKVTAGGQAEVEVDLEQLSPS
ncbi:MAG TPA: DUF4382 domain-containing protein [Cyclobacteriaceae bacterium]|nr:DUF4382 domain-containing protein [Cyclobacteriaceae bacterium]